MRTEGICHLKASSHLLSCGVVPQLSAPPLSPCKNVTYLILCNYKSRGTQCENHWTRGATGVRPAYWFNGNTQSVPFFFLTYAIQCKTFLLHTCSIIWTTFFCAENFSIPYLAEDSRPLHLAEVPQSALNLENCLLSHRNVITLKADI
jgi:hypothetical protein